jgi:head-tail adaptor
MNKLLKSGDFNRAVTILRRNVTKNAHNEEVEGDPTEVETRARVTPAPGTERFASAENAAQAPMRFVIRWRPDPPSVEDSLEMDGRPYAISSVTEIGLHEGWEILAVARAETEE